MTQQNPQYKFDWTLFLVVLVALFLCVFCGLGGRALYDAQAQNALYAKQGEPSTGTTAGETKQDPAGQVPPAEVPAVPTAQPTKAACVSIPQFQANSVAQVAAPLENEDLSSVFPKMVFVNSEVAWDQQKWNWQALPASISNFVVPAGWEATVTVTDRTLCGLQDWQDEHPPVVMFYGPVTIPQIGGATVRHIYGTPIDALVRTPCDMLKYENKYSQSQTKPYPTLAGNFACK